MLTLCEESCRREKQGIKGQTNEGIIQRVRRKVELVKKLTKKEIDNGKRQLTKYNELVKLKS